MVIVAAIVFVAAAAVYTLFRRDRVKENGVVTDVGTTPVRLDDTVRIPAAPLPPPQIVAPLSGAVARVTKKTFGLYVTPKNSPVSPEKFSGYHTGVDFETTADEQTIDVPVRAICAGPIILKKRATGYGGVAVQSCRIDGMDVTVVYGHLRFSSIAAAVGQQLGQGEGLGVLGTGYSTETDGERRHLHLGIHKGTTISILGYVQKKTDLDQWIDAMTYLHP